MTGDEFEVFLETESLSHENMRSEWSDNLDKISKVKAISIFPNSHRRYICYARLDDCAHNY